MRDPAVPRSRRGFTPLILVSMTLIVFLMLGTGAIQLGLFSRPAENSQYHWLQARFLAKSGADAFAHWMIKNPESLSDVEMEQRLSDMLSLNQGKSEPTKLHEIPNGSFTLALERIDDKLLRVISIGEYQTVTEQLTITLEKTQAGGWQKVEGEV